MLLMLPSILPRSIVDEFDLVEKRFMFDSVQEYYKIINRNNYINEYLCWVEHALLQSNSRKLYKYSFLNTWFNRH